MAFTISRNSWHFRLYMFYLRHGRSTYRPPAQICLCPYMRVLLIFLPLYLLSRLMMAAFVASLVFVIVREIVAASTRHGWYIFSLIFGALVAVVGICVLVGVFWEDIKYKMENLKEAVTPDEPKTLAGQWLKSFHEKICPCFDVVE